MSFFNKYLTEKERRAIDNNNTLKPNFINDFKYFCEKDPETAQMSLRTANDPNNNSKDFVMKLFNIAKKHNIFEEYKENESEGIYPISNNKDDYYSKKYCDKQQLAYNRNPSEKRILHLIDLKYNYLN